MQEKKIKKKILSTFWAA